MVLFFTVLHKMSLKCLIFTRVCRVILGYVWQCKVTLIIVSECVRKCRASDIMSWRLHGPYAYRDINQPQAPNI